MDLLVGKVTFTELGSLAVDYRYIDQEKASLEWFGRISKDVSRDNRDDAGNLLVRKAPSIDR